MKTQIIVKFLRLLWINVIRPELNKLVKNTESEIDDLLIEIVDKLLGTEGG